MSTLLAIVVAVVAGVVTQGVAAGLALTRQQRGLRAERAIDALADLYAAAHRGRTVSGQRIAAAAAHLHARGLMHCDLYAHNVLWDGTAGDAALSDFGAACTLPGGAEGAAWRKVEVRAFGLLLAELLDRCDAAPVGLRALEAACVAPDVRARIVDGLAGLGISIDPDRNAVRSSEPRIISPPGSPVTVMVVPTNEELAIARAAAALVVAG